MNSIGLIWISLASSKSKVVERQNSFELFGYDFMVDCNGLVWLIEVNSSPDLSFSTATTKELVSQMLPEMCKTISGVTRRVSEYHRVKILTRW